MSVRAALLLFVRRSATCRDATTIKTLHRAEEDQTFITGRIFRKHFRKQVKSLTVQSEPIREESG